MLPAIKDYIQDDFILKGSKWFLQNLIIPFLSTANQFGGILEKES